MRIVVTGGAGFIGRHTVLALERRGHRVTVLDYAPESDQLEQTVCGDIIEIESVYLALHRGCDAILHLAAQATVSRSVFSPALDAHINILGTINVLKGAEKYAVPRVVCASSGGVVYGRKSDLISEEAPFDPICPYGHSKAAAEAYMRYFAEFRGLHVTALRYANVYGPGQRPQNGVIAAWRRAIIESQPVTIHGDGSAVRDFVHVSDVAAANVAAVEADLPGFHAINIGTGMGTSLNELARLMGATGIHYEPPRAGDLQWNVLNCEHARRLLGWTARVPLRDGLESLCS